MAQLFSLFKPGNCQRKHHFRYLNFNTQLREGFDCDCEAIEQIILNSPLTIISGTTFYNERLSVFNVFFKDSWHKVGNLKKNSTTSVGLIDVAHSNDENHN